MALKKGVKKKEHENLSDANIEAVIGLLEAAKPITKKEACEILNITYNTTRLSNIIEEYKDKIEQDRKRRAANRGKPAADYEITTIIESYLNGDPVKSIADSLYRSTDFVNRIVESVGVPRALSTDTYADFEPLPEQCVAETFEIGEYVWSSKYKGVARIDSEAGMSSDGLCKVYWITVFQRIDETKMLIDGQRYAHHPKPGTIGGFNAAQRAYDLGSLKHLDKYGVNVKRAIK